MSIQVPQTGLTDACMYVYVAILYPRRILRPVARLELYLLIVRTRTEESGIQLQYTHQAFRPVLSSGSFPKQGIVSHGRAEHSSKLGEVRIL